MIRRRAFNVAFIAVSLGLIISLTLNFVYSKRRTTQEHQYKHMLYNQFMFDVYSAAGPPSATFPGFMKAAINTADAASVLNDLYFHSYMVDSEQSDISKQIQEDAGFLSYVSMALVGQNDGYYTEGNKLLVTMTPNQAKVLITEIRKVVMQNVVNGSDIPDDKIDAVYSGIHNLIPADFKSLAGGDVFEFFRH